MTTGKNIAFSSNPMQSPLIRYGVIAITGIIWYAIVFDPLSNKITGLSDEAMSLEARIARIQTDVKIKKGIDHQVKLKEQEYDAKTAMLIPGENAQLVATKLQDVLLKKATDSGVTVMTYNISSTKKWKNHQLATVNITIKTNTENLAKYLWLVEQGNELIRISQLNVMPVKGKDPHLRVTITAEALLMQAEQSAKK